MDVLAFVFSGQGAQAPGMGKNLSEASAAAAKVFDMAERIRPGTRAQCFDGTREELSLTINTQPCLFCVDLAAAEALRERGIVPDMVAGFSLGEIPALAFSGMMSHEDAFALVCRRAEEMHACAQETAGGMAAVLGLENHIVEQCCEAVGEVYPVNYNCPGQLVIAGAKDKLTLASAEIKQRGGKVIPLPVSGAFHSPYMAGARAALCTYLEEKTLQEPAMPVFSNATGLLYEAPFAKLIAKQVVSPVRWQETVTRMAEMGATTFVEVGVGKTLCGLIRKILPSATVRNVEDQQSLENVVATMNGASVC